MIRKNNAPSISFFSFQDIVTSVTGIMFLIVLFQLLLIFEVRETLPRAESLPAEAVAAETPPVEIIPADHGDLADQWRRLQREKRQLQEELVLLPEPRSVRNLPGAKIRLTVPDYAGKQLLLADISADEIIFHGGSAGENRHFSSPLEFAGWIEKQEFSGKYLILFFRPSGFGLYRPLLKALEPVPLQKSIEILPDEKIPLSEEKNDENR